MLAFCRSDFRHELSSHRGSCLITVMQPQTIANGHKKKPGLHRAQETQLED